MVISVSDIVIIKYLFTYLIRIHSLHNYLNDHFLNIAYFLCDHIYWIFHHFHFQKLILYNEPVILKITLKERR